MVESPDQKHNRTANKEQECTRDCLVRWYYGEAAMAGLPPERGAAVRDRDLFPVPPPVNNALYALWGLFALARRIELRRLRWQPPPPSI